ncbi:UDP-N-acetylmuramoyl-tripeptide--D-alanyl-D-alanine ligase [Psychrobacter frigidicola]|uniref:UDP-N-acetylmuramoyl-tripeptide--D-alanyl-D-alanine ligase n=1 Tax=Psychrobacter frigidicola TaxID=45611 RepID=A0A5C7A1B3_9GAMM|nr:UDP-N-acetylmuramoyl-tripeptide--D-alanyl-D-alanine ligase [Psychrobacter frigidicola]TXD96236.1 UDP-N-acetylmuramoyl-tripeptide--D-alanyl-D-alanine ligase [Psychrobacter frigidicola]
MTADNNNSMQSQGLYVWQADNLLAATAALNGHWQLGDGQKVIEQGNSYIEVTSCRIATDTRAIEAGDIFLAINGDNFDGHDYIDTAVTQGAIAVIVSRPISTSAPQLVVSDTRLALGQLAAYRRQQHPDLTVIAITGSSGKTTCKEMLGSIFNRLAPTLITRGNLNNDFGVPMMMLELSDQHRYAILELGANHIGEIAYTAELVRPDVACILNIGTAHLGEFGSREGICQTKAEIFHTLSDEQYAIVPDTDDYAKQLRQIAATHTSHVLGFGTSDVTASDINIKPEGSEFTLHIGTDKREISLPLAGEHNINNALAAAACAYALNIDIDDIGVGLENARPAKGRLNSQTLGMHHLIDDTYNANPHSVRAATKVLAAQTGTQIMVLGDIGELGEAAVSEHHNLGRTIAGTSIDMLLCVGEYAHHSVAGAQAVGGINAQAFNDKVSLLQYLQPYLQAQQAQPCTVLFKGSRSMKMETLIDALVKE